MSVASIVVVVSGLLALGCSAVVIAPASRQLIATLRALIDAARHANPERFQRTVEPISPFSGGRFEHRRITPMLKTDFAPFGTECQRLHVQARRLDRRAHYGLLPLALFALGCLLWYGAAW